MEDAMHRACSTKWRKRKYAYVILMKKPEGKRAV
jgi:hypothetical protein